MASPDREPDFTRLIPDLQSWQECNRGSFSVEDWIYHIGNFAHLIAYGRLLWPDFFEYDDCILRGAPSCVTEAFENNYRTWLDRCQGDKIAVERVLNHLHICDLFGDPSGTEDQYVYIGRFLQQTWQAKLNHDFPDRRFCIIFDERESENVEDYEITFWQLQI